MSISSAISNAVTGLNAASRGAENVSTNIANALTPGYARREVDLAPRSSGQAGGVQITGIRRLIDTALLGDSRLAQASAGASGAIASFHAAMEQAFGTAGSSSSLGSNLTQFSAAVSAAAARPDSETRLTAVLDTATDLAERINDIATAIQAERSKAEQAIESDVAQLNRALAQVADLNGQIVSLKAQGKDPSSLMDARQAAIDAVAQILPIREVARENDRVALFTTEGSVLLDGTTPARLGFDSTAQVSADMSLAGGQLNALTLNGKPLSGVQMQMLSGGRLGAGFEIRDRVAPQYQQQIDAFARELHDRLASPSVDASLPAGSPGLFTDAQSILNPANETGFASRIAVTATVDPDSGGALWRIRAGLNAPDAGSVGESSLLLRIDAALAASQAPGSATFPPAKRNLAALASELASGAASNRLRSAADALQDSTHHNGLKSALLADGVDTDREMEGLLALERAYSANAKVFQTANDMLDTILRWT
ncbi:flagellar hook-associated protein FlgK [Paracoccus sp. (in: a-proteobacteria)]|uniref:flagellar hook-associated protein FlgK n=1 Tax=Paracoccus sp. TaxID=267 RepID=UPI00321FE820